MAEDQQQKFKAWIDARLEETVHALMEKNVFDGALVEAKPAWAFPFQVLIGKIREQGDTHNFSWFICGDFPTDHAASAIAATPREAARYFSLSWQLKAARSASPDSELIERAEALYELVNEDRLWPDG